VCVVCVCVCGAWGVVCVGWVCGVCVCGGCVCGCVRVKATIILNQRLKAR